MASESHDWSPLRAQGNDSTATLLVWPSHYRQLMPEIDEFLTVAQIAELLKLNQQTVRNWIDQGSLPAVRVGRRVRIKREDFDELLERGTTRPRRPARKVEVASIWDGEIPMPVVPD
jgi:excisionase family DNA binding protein